jgi:hypothetical protein
MVIKNDQPTLQTAQGRLAVLERVASDFSRHLETVQGAVLGPDLRLAVAQCARDALSYKKDDKGADESSSQRQEQVCYSKNANLYEIFSQMKHEKPIAVSSSVSQNVASTVTCIVYAIVNHQDKLNRQWYENCLEEIKTCGLIDASKYSASKRDVAVHLACYSALSEIILLTAMSHGFHVLYLALDKAPPKLPANAAAMAPGPSYVDFSLLLRRWRHDPDKTTASLYYLWPDVNKTSPEFLKLTEGTRAHLPTILASAMGVSPRCPCTRHGVDNRESRGHVARPGRLHSRLFFGLLYFVSPMLESFLHHRTWSCTCSAF